MYSWSISELKNKGRASMGRAYWKCVLCALILTLAGGAAGSSSGGRAVTQYAGNGGNAAWDYHFDAFPSFIQIVPFMIFLAVAAIVVSVIFVAVDIFLLAPLEVGAEKFFVVNRVQDADLGEVGTAFRAPGYLNVVKTQFLRRLYIFLWSLLLVIPGIVKSYEYRMVPYILSENPEIDNREAFRLSRNMMDGEKWNAFVLDLSFIGWHILSCFTLGLLDLFYTNPYQQCTNVELYDVLKTRMFSNANAFSSN